MSRCCLIMILLVLTFTTGCVKERRIEYVELYTQVLGFDDNDDWYKSIPEDNILMVDEKEFDEFNEEYFISRELPIDFPSDDQAELFIQVPADHDMVDSYGITTICKRGHELTVTLKKTGTTKVHAAEGFNGTFKWVIIAEVDKTYLSDNMRIVVKKELN